MKEKLTEKLLKSLCPADKPFEVVDSTFPGFLLRVQPAGSMIFYLSYRTPSGKRNRIKLGLYGQITLAQARELAKTHCGDLAKGIDPQAEKRAKVQKATEDQAGLLGVFIRDHYKPWVTKNRKSHAKTLKLLEKTFSHWSSVPMRELTKPIVQKWQLSELKREVKPATVNRNLNALRGVLTRAVEQGILSTHPLSGVKNVKECEENRIRYLSESETKGLLAALEHRNHEFIAERRSFNLWLVKRHRDPLPDIPDHHYADHLTPLVLVAMYTGLRRGELFQLLWSDIDFNTAMLTVRGATAKSSRVRYVPLNTKAAEALTRWQESSGGSTGLVFPNPDGEVLKSIKTAWGGLLKKAGITDFRFHDLRHNFASHLVMQGVPLNTVRDLLGHADMKTTLRYAHLSDDQKVAAVASLSF